MPKGFYHRRWLLVLLVGMGSLATPERNLLPRLDWLPGQSSALSAVHTRDFLQLYTRNTPTTYYEGRQGPTGFEYELVRRFADELGVSLAVDRSHHIEGVLDAVRSGEADLGAAGLVLDPLTPGIRYSRPIMSLQPIVIYRRGLNPPTSVEDLVGLKIGALANSGSVLALRNARRDHPELGWRETHELENTDLIAMVASGRLDAAVIYAHAFKLSRIFFPGVENGFELGQPLTLAWAFPASGDLSLLERANRFIDRMHANGELERLEISYFGHDDYLEYVGARRFISQTRKHLDQWTDEFLAAARKTGFDWKLLAAISYQESHWNPEATSPTGVRGMMMLTRTTAARMNVDDRIDPAQSIDGGARYLQELVERLPDDIPSPDRLWMALAAYNIGMGHLADARLLADRQGLDPDRWEDVRKMLPRLQESRWYHELPHGFARGKGAVYYVRNIRRYHEILSYVTRSQRQFAPLVNSRAASLSPSFNIVTPDAAP
ncbi:membrane-bound lytic murein transglycosylase F [Kushneria sinocarnis]|uniref:Membrane-bound lytic murein transglycosylase F n=1 Tax=Kushneria sinocarnis TaxID=595502 RepID=A0A420WZH1_9GAMM|nr:membrane-bound lytic murein transglycosylase MltF [Kushneria sinocarnis]RKR06677.1 membrane-bound lytic murein transglycosylase F [Kushneria sinocarnis]